MFYILCEYGFVDISIVYTEYLYFTRFCQRSLNMEKLVIEEIIPLGSSKDNRVGPRIPLPGTGDSAG